MSYRIISNDDVLIHYGILGQKWGVRRFQNPDGTYTLLGKRRRREDSGYNIYAKDVKAKMNTYDDKTLQQKLQRLNMQKQINKMARDSDLLHRGLRTATAVLAAAGTITALYKLKDNPIVQDGKNFILRRMKK